jgi:tetratricopeptide (TPR) repeat protein
LPPATSGLFKSLRNRKALEEHERINNELLREARSEFAWTKQMLEVMAQWQSVGSETRATATTELIFTAEEIDRYYGGDRSKALYDQGGKFLELHQYEKAEASFRAAIDLNPSFSWAHCNLAITLDDAGRHAEALACIDRAIELDPSDTDFPQRRKEILDNLHRKRGTGA